jgi:hypothetical protein
VAAFPFGGHPTLAAYIDWARQQGSRARSGVKSDEDGMVHSLTQIICDNTRKWVTVVGIQQNEHLVATMIGYLDRRLGLKSPFAAIDDPSMDPE